VDEWNGYLSYMIQGTFVAVHDDTNARVLDGKLKLTLGSISLRPTPAKGAGVVGLKNIVSLQSVSVASSGACDPPLASNCYSIQQDFWITTSGNTPSYWAQNILLVWRARPSVLGWRVAHCYHLFTLAELRDKKAPSYGGLCSLTAGAGVVISPSTTFTLESTITQGAVSFMATAGTHALSKTDVQAGLPASSTVTTFASAPATSCPDNRMSSTPLSLLPELMLVGEWTPVLGTAELATFSGKTTGSVQSETLRIVSGRPNWTYASREAVVPNPQCATTSEQSLGLRWIETGSGQASFDVSRNSSEEGVAYLP
jgi:hypothetical protein